MESVLAISSFIALSIFVVVCMFKKISDKFMMGAIYSAPLWAKVTSVIGYLGFFFYVALCADWIVLPGVTLEFDGRIAFGILALATAIPVAAGKYQE